MKINRDQRRTILFEYRQWWRNKTWRQSIEAEEAETPSWSSKTRKEAEIPSWSSIVKPLLPKVLRVNESKTQKHRSRVVMTHGGEEGIFKNFENSRYQQDANEETSGRNQSLNGETRAYETNRSERESQTNMSMVTRLGEPRKRGQPEMQMNQRMVIKLST